MLKSTPSVCESTQVDAQGRSVHFVLMKIVPGVERIILQVRGTVIIVAASTYLLSWGSAKLIIIHYYRSEEGQIKPITAEAGQAQTNASLIQPRVKKDGVVGGEVGSLGNMLTTRKLQLRQRW